MAPPITPVAPDEMSAFYQALGHAITCWQHIEMGLCSIFVLVSGCKDEKIASAVFYSPMDFSEKLNITRNAARLSLDKAQFKEFADLRTRLINESETRNAFAHFVLYNMLSYPMDGVEDKYTVFLMPNAYDPNEIFKYKDRKSHLKKINIEDIIKAKDRFNVLANDLHLFAGKLANA